MGYESLESREPFAINVISQIYVLQCYCLAAITFLYYDHIITFSKEVNVIWRQKFSLITILFLLNRYITFFGYIPIIFFLFDSPTAENPCHIFSRVPGTLNCISQVLIAIFLVMRSYALFYGNNWVLIVTTSLALASVATSAWALSKVVTTNLTFGPETVFKSCVPTNLTSGIPFILSWLLSMVFDTVVFVLTVTKTYRMSKVHRAMGLHSHMAGLIMRDGSMYFAVMAVANLINFALFLPADQVQSPTYFEESTGNNSVLTHTISVTMMSRLVLNLRSATHHDGYASDAQRATPIIHSSDRIMQHAACASCATSTKTAGEVVDIRRGVADGGEGPGDDLEVAVRRLGNAA